MNEFTAFLFGLFAHYGYIASAGWWFAHSLVSLVEQTDNVRLALLWLGGSGLVLFVLMKLWIRRLHDAAQQGSVPDEASA